MRQLIFLLFLVNALLSYAQYDNTDLAPYPPFDSCRTVLDISLDDSTKYPVLKITKEALLEIDTLWTYNQQCGAQQTDTIICEYFRLIIAPQNSPASMITQYGAFSKTAKELLKPLVAGDRVLIEDIKYSEGEISRLLRPLVIYIVD